MTGYTVAVVGATGLVGGMMLRVLEERSFPVHRLVAVASDRSAGRSVRFAGEEYPVLPVSASVFDGVDVALFSAGGDASRQWSPVAVERGAVVIDNSSAWRMTEGVPLVVPEVNAHAVPDSAPRIIANPNCSTIQMVVALRPLRDRYGLRRVFVSTYQAASGAGQRGLDQFDAELRGQAAERPVFAHTLLDNALPHIAPFLDNGSTVEEMKMVHETRKILELPALPVSVTCVRVPVRNAHSEAVHVELNADFTIEELREVLAASEGIVIEDDTSAARYPLAHEVAGRDEVFVGRIRRDTGMERGVALWVVSDNVRKGAATNAVQIAEHWRALRERGK
ncbi:MAG TPA: aspartate-semialdehyde dehydrogenase [Bacteroidota bacterium]|nr:aspartate-semialdehyde dehydrogenase [Bacteroidota bacterium]